MKGICVMQCNLADKKCIPCRGGVDPLKGDELLVLARQLARGWEVVNEHHLARSWKFNDFAEAMAFTNKVGAIAEQQGHHPDIHLSWGQVDLEIHTHKIDGLTESDFILVAKIDQI